MVELYNKGIMDTENKFNENEEIEDIEVKLNKLAIETFKKIHYFSDKYGYEERFLYVQFMEKMKELVFWIV